MGGGAWPWGCFIVYAHRGGLERCISNGGSVKMVWAYYENEKTGFLDNKAYKRYYTVMR